MAYRIHDPVDAYRRPGTGNDRRQGDAHPTEDIRAQSCVQLLGRGRGKGGGGSVHASVLTALYPCHPPA
eukprot:1390104-Amorphochlora_amoeboformis.AAC.1